MFFPILGMLHLTRLLRGRQSSLHLDLLLLESVDGILINDVLQKHVTMPVESEVIDQFFISFVVKTG
jgi:hypothetical protein